MTVGELQAILARRVNLGDLDPSDPVVVDWPSQVGVTDLRVAEPLVVRDVTTTADRAASDGTRRRMRPANPGEAGVRCLRLA